MEISRQARTPEARLPAGIAPEIETVRLGDLDAKRLRNFTKAELMRLCERFGLPVAGTKGNLVDKLIGKKLGGDRRQIPGKTLCPDCKMKGLASSTRETVVIYRCNNPKCKRRTFVVGR